MYKRVALCIVLIIIFLPKIFWFSAVNKFVLAKLSPDVSIDTIELSWWGSTCLKGVSVKESFVCEKLIHKKSLLSWLLRPHDLDTVILQNPKATINVRKLLATPPLLDLSDDTHLAIKIKNGTIDIEDSNTHLSQLDLAFDGAIRQGTFFLKKPFKARCGFVQDSRAKSTTPITVSITQKDFCVPLVPFSLEKMTLGSIRIDPGVIVGSHLGIIESIMALLRANASLSQTVPLWFTPLYLELKRGVLTLQRTDCLAANAFPVALWGKIDLVHDKIEIQLGLSCQTLKRAFAIITLDSYMLQIPIRGTLNAPKIDSGLATTKIASLRLAEMPDPATMLIGDVLGLATYVAEDKQSTPPPTTTPFPWEKPK